MHVTVLVLRFLFERLYDKQNMTQHKEPNSGDLLPCSIKEKSWALRLGRDVLKMSKAITVEEINILPYI